MYYQNTKDVDCGVKIVLKGLELAVSGKQSGAVPQGNHRATSRICSSTQFFSGKREYSSTIILAVRII